MIGGLIEGVVMFHMGKLHFYQILLALGLHCIVSGTIEKDYRDV